MNACVSVFSKLGLFFMVGLLALGPVAALAQPPEPATPIDFKVDANKDGLPDELVAELETIMAMVDGAGEADIEAQAAFDRAALDLLERLPYAAETRRLQAQAATLQQQLDVAADLEDAQGLLAELRAIEAKLMQDPALALTLETLDAVLAARAGPDTAGLNRQVFLPVITSGAGMFTDTLSAAAAEECTWDCLEKGDILLINGGDPLTSFLYARDYAHSGNYYGGGEVFESNLLTGVRLQSLEIWKTPGGNVWAGYDIKVEQGDVADGLDAAEKMHTGKPYNLNFANKSTEDAFYCSQLVWNIHKKLNVNLDSNDPGYRWFLILKWGFLGWFLAWSGVAPDEIYLDSGTDWDDDLTERFHISSQ